VAEKVFTIRGGRDRRAHRPQTARESSTPIGRFRPRIVKELLRRLSRTDGPRNPAAHALLGAGAASARLLYVSIPPQWQRIAPGVCDNRIGYWHAPGARLVYRVAGQRQSFGIASFISRRGQWYVVHLAPFDRPGTVLDPGMGLGAYGSPGGC
jgi:hypothetical protein